ncbi:hypothetical protein BKA15_000222 [Microlunatus parietis]|uniref:Uncharacterized protein n=2 Tax=Microlunatus parietis TaxID=682979 RepID=A0A7Y9L9K7_9ACTN|nr:hypothetical protein [Microlunatus parietis]
MLDGRVNLTVDDFGMLCEALGLSPVDVVVAALGVTS